MYLLNALTHSFIDSLPCSESRRVSDYCSNAGSGISYSSKYYVAILTPSPDLVIYEYFITLGREVELFWKGEWTGAAALFFFNRYLSLIVYTYGLAGDAHISAQVCVNCQKRALLSLSSRSTFLTEVRLPRGVVAGGRG